jgi:hypothetical protein
MNELEISPKESRNNMDLNIKKKESTKRIEINSEKNLKGIEIYSNKNILNENEHFGNLKMAVSKEKKQPNKYILSKVLKTSKYNNKYSKKYYFYNYI